MQLASHVMPPPDANLEPPVRPQSLQGDEDLASPSYVPTGHFSHLAPVPAEATAPKLPGGHHLHGVKGFLSWS